MGWLDPDLSGDGEKLMGMGAWVIAGIADVMWRVTLEAIKEIGGGMGKSRQSGRRRRLLEWVECVGEGVKRELKKVYKTTKAKLTRERKARDLDQVKCIKDEEGKVLVDEISMARGVLGSRRLSRAISRMAGKKRLDPMRSVDFWKKRTKAV
ncbi:hypothetical protein H5410_027060 [Solanum commersonii]|uniref:Uncharacterized protein n=1 Tax=Solanum commersonii TaxID=4109 RepID=A0A9J5Z0P8_SOLCO|nr:hypothetical protein H5410_027060 [Solanum commersonii]